MSHPLPPAPRRSPLVYLFERFPAFTQTFCAREVLAMDRAGWAPLIFSIRDPRERGEPAPDFLPAEVAARVRYLPGEKEIIQEVALAAAERPVAGDVRGRGARLAAGAG